MGERPRSPQARCRWGGLRLVDRHYWHGGREVVIENAWTSLSRHPGHSLPRRTVKVRYLDDGTRESMPFSDLTRTPRKSGRRV
jgi:hypothetical protein